MFVNIHGGICDAILERPGYPMITRTGNSIRIVEYGVHVDSEDWCIYGEGTLTAPIGPFSPGNYTLAVDFIYPDLSGPTTVTLGVIPFAVTGVTRAAPVPTSTAFGQIALLCLISGTALLALWMRRRQI